MFQIIKDILSAKTNASCMRFCVMAIVLTIVFNWIVGALAVFFVEGAVFNIEIQEVASLFGVLLIKWGQKKTENGAKE